MEDRPRRRPTRTVAVGPLLLGGDAPVRVQSMCSTRTEDREATLIQARRLAAAGCELVRVAVPNRETLAVLPFLKERLEIPLVADIHFDHRLALGALERGVDKVRINPGNLGGRDRFARVIEAALRHGAALRIGVNAGSLEKRLLEKHGRPTAEALVESALDALRFAEEAGLDRVVISIKSSSTLETVRACRRLAEITDAPQHLGITEAGIPEYGRVKSAVGLGPLLLDGIGDTIRVSLTGDPVAEVYAAYDILKAAGVRMETPEIIACPTCGRMECDMGAVALEVSERLRDRRLPIRVAVMGCVVNGPGEARAADVGIAGGRGFGLLFRGGRPLRRVPAGEMASALIAEIDRLEGERAAAGEGGG